MKDKESIINNIPLLIKIISLVGYGGSIALFIIMGIFELFSQISILYVFGGLIFTFIITRVLHSRLNKNSKQTLYNNYKNLLTKSGMSNYKTVNFKDLVSIDIDIQAKLLGAYSYYESIANVVKFSDVLDFEVIENGNSVVSSRSGSAVVGGLLFGGLGAIAGASGSRTINETCNTLKLKIYCNDVCNSVITLDFLENNIPKNSYLYRELTDIINEMISFLKIAREHNRQDERKEDKKVTVENVEYMKQNNNLSSLKELAELKEKGIITENEFEESKKKILSKI